MPAFKLQFKLKLELKRVIWNSLTMPSSNINNLSYKTPNEVIQNALERRHLELSKHIWHAWWILKIEGENSPVMCIEEHSTNMQSGQLTSSPSMEYNSSCRTPNDALPVALESRHPELSNDV